MLADRIRMSSIQNGGFDDNSGSPGSNMLLSGDMSAGYFGVIPVSELFSGSQISTECNITQGVLQFDSVGWLKFAIDGKIIFKSQKTYRHSISWDYLNSRGCVFGSKVLKKLGLDYKVRLMKTGTTNPMNNPEGILLHESEWNKLMIPINIKAKTNTGWYSPSNLKSTISYWGVDFTDADLHATSAAGKGATHWCQETYSSTFRMVRGLSDVSRSLYYSSSTSAESIGWSPVLELDFPPQGV